MEEVYNEKKIQINKHGPKIRKEPFFVMPHASIADKRMRTSTVDAILPNAKNVCLFSTPFSLSAEFRCALSHRCECVAAQLR